ncbi:hypothetical protein FB451DRAFT_1556051 [Mycena latifolia]|nr:hypothetical protein FB451DRAFT_1556051 [Mycena latifolia]
MSHALSVPPARDMSPALAPNTYTCVTVSALASPCGMPNTQTRPANPPRHAGSSIRSSRCRTVTARLQTSAVCALGGRASQPTYEAHAHVPPAKLGNWPPHTMAAFAFARPRSRGRYGATLPPSHAAPTPSTTASPRGPAQSPQCSADAARCALGALLHRGHAALALESAGYPRSRLPLVPHVSAHAHRLACLASAMSWARSEPVGSGLPPDQPPRYPAPLFLL